MFVRVYKVSSRPRRFRGGLVPSAGRAELDCTTIERSIWQLALNRQCDFRSCSIIATRAEVVSAPSVAAGHIGRGLSHVDENEAFGLQVEWSVETRPRTGAGCRADSARSSPSPNLTCNMVLISKCPPCSRRNDWSSASVMSLLSVIIAVVGSA
jgi:hypothetical protein